MNYELKELKKDYRKIRKFQRKRRSFVKKEQNLKENTTTIGEYDLIIKSSMYKNLGVSIIAVDEEIYNIQSKYDKLFKGIYLDDYDYSPFTDFLLVLIRFLENKG